jgi:dihydroflavonol-4-reductase
MLLVTGAAGFIGDNLVRILLKKDYNIRALCLNKEEAARVPKKVEKVIGDITKPETLRNIGKDIDKVVHLAGVVSYSMPRERMFFINVDGTRNLLKECTDVDKFIFSSSVSVYGEIKGEADESYPFSPKNPYGESKAEDERLILDSGLKHVMLRIAPIYGLGSPSWLKNLGLLERGFPIPNTKNTTHIVHVSDAVQAFVKAVEKGNGVYNIADKEPLPFVEFAESIVRLLGKTPKRLPYFIVALLARAKGMKPYLDVLTMNRNYVIRKAEKELGYAPEADFGVETKKMVEWYRKHD